MLNLKSGIKKILIFILLLSGLGELYASHLVGGYISYEYIAENSTGVRYRITITAYRDCKPSSLDFTNTINVCVFNRNNLNLASSHVFTINTREKVQPVGRTDCPEAANVCLEKAVYEDYITLPKSSFGYFVKWEVCCRNEQVNLKNDASTGVPFIGQTYQAIIPPSNIRNSSPVFDEVPVPFICINDTVQLNNYAIDPDGDVLFYRLATPWYGADINNSTPNCKSFYTAPVAINPADYTTGYNGTIPFGTTGISQINSVNGVATFKATQVGNYAVAIDVDEYRDGVLLGTTRLDLQILVILCSPNNKPNISAGTKDYTIQAGEQLCFDVIGVDKDAQQNLTVNGFGDILTGANGFKGNKATFAPAFGKSGVSSTFCWQTSCDQFSDTAYVFTARVVDDGCPSKFTIVNYSILVKKFTGRTTVNGPLSVCQGSKNVIYNFTTTADSPQELVGITHEVEIEGGVIVQQNATNVVVNWLSDATGKLTVTPISAHGCPGVPDDIDVILQPAPPVPNLLAIDTVCENTFKTYSTTNTPGNTYRWWVVNGNIIGGNTDGDVDITWGVPGSAKLKLVQYNASGCPSDTAEMDVWISKPQTPPIQGREVICPNSSNIPYSVQSSDAGSAYQWWVEGGTIASISGNQVFVDWGNQGPGRVRVLELNKFGCPGDTVSLNVLKDYNLISETIEGDTDICEFSTGMIFSVPFTPATTYNWAVTGGTLVSGQGSNSITIDWGAAGQGTVSMYESSFDTINNRACISNLQVRNVNIRPYPTANTIVGVPEVCQYSPVGVYTLAGMANSNYIWSINGDTSDIVGQGTSSISIDYQEDGNFTLEVTEVSEFGCEGNPVQFNLIVHPQPTTGPIVGDSIICYPNLLNHNYSVSGMPTSTFTWFIQGGTILPPGTGSSIAVNWSGIQNNRLQVLEVSDFGCPGDTMSLNVFYDQPSVYLNLITVNPPPANDDGIDLNWELRNAPRYNSSLIIERRRAGTGQAFVEVGSVDGSQVNFNHSPVNNDSNAWEYRLKGEDLCGQTLYSEIHTEILLRGQKTGGYEVMMNFSPYIGWGSANIKYDVFRQLKGKTEYELYEANVTDFAIEYSNGLEHYTQCYRIRATMLGTDSVTWSNDICFNFDPVLFIPDAFSPNLDDINDLYGVKAGALKTFEFAIYNRWGERVYTTDDIDFKWDGVYKGEVQPQDVYMYYCNYSGFDGRRYSTKGTITLLR